MTIGKNLLEQKPLVKIRMRKELVYAVLLNQLYTHFSLANSYMLLAIECVHEYTISRHFKSSAVPLYHSFVTSLVLLLNTLSVMLRVVLWTSL